MIFDPMYFIYLAPALILAFWAQMKVKSAYAAASQVPARMTGAQAASEMLHAAGIDNVSIEQIGGQLSDHYDPRAKVLRLSRDVYAGRSMAAVGIAAHEAGHAIQDARQYLPLVIRNAAVPAASFGSNSGMLMFIVGMFMSQSYPVVGDWLIMGGIALFAAVVFFQVVNLPVEFDASNRAKAELVGMGIVGQNEMTHVNKVLNAAAMTYVAATLQAILTLLYFIMRASDRR